MGKQCYEWQQVSIRPRSIYSASPGGRLVRNRFADCDSWYREYLARRDIHSLLQYARIEPIAHGQGTPFWTALYGFRRRASQIISRLLPEPQASLLNGILLGIESGIPRQLQDDFNTTGTSHVLAISGFNIASIAGLSSRLRVGHATVSYWKGKLVLEFASKQGHVPGDKRLWSCDETCQHWDHCLTIVSWMELQPCMTESEATASSR